jgi:hypothetical protein
MESRAELKFDVSILLRLLFHTTATKKMVWLLKRVQWTEHNSSM